MRRPPLGTPLPAALFLLGAAAVSVVLPSTARAADVAQAQVVSADPVGWTPAVLDGEVDAVAQVGDRIVVGGTFTKVQDPGGGTTYARPFVASFDAHTGVVDPAFHPALDGPVTALAAAGSTVYVGGQFTHVDGVAQRGVARLALDGSRVAGFAGHLDDGLVDTLVVHGAHVYVGGRFSRVGGVPRAGLAALNPTTGAPDASLTVGVAQSRSTSSLPFVRRVDVTPDGTTLVVAGNFQSVGGLPRNQMALIDLTTNRVTSWATDRFVPVCSPATYSYIRDLAVSPDGRYVVVVGGGGPKTGTLCDSAQRWELGRTGAGQQPTWVDPTGGDTLTAVAVTGTAVYVGGHQRWLNNYYGANSAGPGAVDRPGIAALDPVSGVPFTWNPGLQRNQEVGDLLPTAEGLWVGYDALQVAGETHPRIAMLPLAGGTTVPGVQGSELPRIVYASGTDGSLVRRGFNGSTFGAPTSISPGSVPWATVHGAFMAAGQVFYTTTDGHLWVAAFDGTTFSTPVDTGTWWDLTGVQGLTFDSGRLYYVKGDGRLYYRWFSPASQIVGSQPVTVTNTGFTDARQLFVAGGALYFSRADGRLYRMAMAGDGVTGTPVVVSGPGKDALTWYGTSAFLSSVPLDQLIGLRHTIRELGPAFTGGTSPTGPLPIPQRP